MTPTTRGKRPSTVRQTALRREPQRTAQRLAREAADRERRVVLTAKFDRVWSALVRLRAKVGATRFQDLMVDLPDALDEIRSPDQRGVVEFHELLGGDNFRAFLRRARCGRDGSTWWWSGRRLPSTDRRAPDERHGPIVGRLARTGWAGGWGALPQ